MVQISIVTISFNQREFLPRCIASIAGQDFPDYEHIIVDPGSTDGSREWLETIQDPKIKLLFEPDSGPADGLNHGLSEVRGQIFLYLNADDELTPGSLARIHQLHIKYPDAEVLIGNGWTIDSVGNPQRMVRSDCFSPIRYALSVGTVLQQATSIKTSLIQKGLRFNPENTVNWDTELLFDAHDMGAVFRNVSDQLGYFRLHSNSITVSGRYKAELQARRRSLVSGRVKIPLMVLRPISVAARLVKLIRTRSPIVTSPGFPGLVAHREEIL